MDGAEVYLFYEVYEFRVLFNLNLYIEDEEDDSAY